MDPLYEGTHYVKVHTVWRYTLCEGTHCVMAHTVWRYTICEGAHRVRVHTVWRYTPCEGTHRVKVHTVWRYTLYEGTHCMKIHTVWRYTFCEGTHCVKVHTVWRYTLRESTHCVKVHTVWRYTQCEGTHCVKVHIRILSLNSGTFFEYFKDEKCSTLHLYGGMGQIFYARYIYFVSLNIFYSTLQDLFFQTCTIDTNYLIFVWPCLLHTDHLTRPPHPGYRPTTTWVHYTSNCKTQSSAPEDGQIIVRNMLSRLKLFIKLSLIHLVGYRYYLFDKNYLLNTGEDCRKIFSLTLKLTFRHRASSI